MDTLQAGIEKSNLIFSLKSVVFSTIDDDGKPYTSYAPFGVYQGDYYLIISNMAKHTKYLRQRPTAGLLWIEDESVSKSVFFRKRLYLETNVTLDIEDEAAIKMMIERLGDPVKSFLLMDFTIIKCEAIQGQLVLGPGQAFDVLGRELSPSKAGGHRSTKA
ncbi:MAG: pyridoxamine 5'-phosphate oxidase family protein [Acholeplasmataceae bacterium]|jgi:putative heme iron utilization protein|nr:pyridoxamine 5'-phosphate oxidase family protein [Acholeplasmataceae bacterium]